MGGRPKERGCRAFSHRAPPARQNNWRKGSFFSNKMPVLAFPEGLLAERVPVSDSGPGMAHRAESWQCVVNPLEKPQVLVLPTFVWRAGPFPHQVETQEWAILQLPIPPK
jgi:hypothetical protein